MADTWDDNVNDHRQYDAAMRWQLLLAENPDLAAKDAQVKAELAMEDGAE